MGKKHTIDGAKGVSVSSKEIAKVVRKAIDAGDDATAEKALAEQARKDAAAKAEALKKFDAIREGWVDADKAAEFKDTLDDYAQQSVDIGACKSKADFYHMYSERKYTYDDAYIASVKKPYLEGGASSVVSDKDIVNAFSRFGTVGRGEHGNFTTSTIEDVALLYDSDGKLVDGSVIENIKGVDPGKYSAGAFQYSYDPELVASANDSDLLRVVDGTTPGSSSLNIPGGKTWAGKSMQNSESELLMPSIDVSDYDSDTVFADIKKQGYFEIKNPTIIAADGTKKQAKGSFRVNGM